MINLIVAFDDKYSIGKDNQIPWHFSEDLINFKKNTSGHVCIMGRKTWESLPDQFRPLPNRVNIVISKKINEEKNKFYCFDSFLSAINFSKKMNKEIFIIGGRNIFKESLSSGLIQKAIVTHVFGDYKGDVKFPEEEWIDFIDKVNKKNNIFENKSIKIVEYLI